MKPDKELFSNEKAIETKDVEIKLDDIGLEMIDEVMNNRIEEEGNIKNKNTPALQNQGVLNLYDESAPNQPVT